MNSQQIVIKNNGPVRDFQMEINSINLLIGEQATGKSTIAKSIYFFRNIKTLLTDFLIQIAENGSYHQQKTEGKPFYKLLSDDTKSIFVKLFGYSWDLNPDFQMSYNFSDDIFIEVNLGKRAYSEKKYISVTYSKNLIQQIQHLTNEAQNFYDSQLQGNVSLALNQEEKNRNRSYIINRINEIFMDDFATYYIPAGRSLLTVLSASRGTMNQAQNLDLITERFMLLIDSIRGSFNSGVHDAYKYYPNGKRPYDVHKLVRKIIGMQKGEYYNTQNGEELRISENDDENAIKLNFMSSGQQELLWLVNFLYVLILRQEKSFVIIEEPEAHIYPSLQKEVAEFMMMCSSYCSGRILCTTHSPYILSSFNNFLYAGFVSSFGEYFLSKVKEIVPQSAIIHKGELTAIKLLTAKKDKVQYENLIAEEANEIRSEMLDEISDTINEDYTKLYSIYLDATES